jgi:hypothetical protein
MSNVTLNLGIRYDKQAMAQPDVLNPDTQLLAAGYRTDHINVDKDNWAPRLGLAWTPRGDGRTVVRAGYGVFYGRTPSIMIGTAHSNNGINVQTISFTGTQIPTYPNIYPTLPTGSTIPKPTIFVFDPNFENPKVEQSSLGFEQQVGNDFSVGVTYQYVKGSDLPRSRDINVSNPTTITTPVCNQTSANVSKCTDPANIVGSYTETRYTGRPFANFNRVIAFESSARSKYDGLTLDLQKRFSNNWQARLAWTHSRVKDNKPDATAVVPFSSGDDSKYVSDPLNIDADYAYGDNDVRDRIVLSGVWSLDGYASNVKSGVLHALVSGWTLSGIFSYQSGQPFNPVAGSDLNNDGNSANDLAPGFTRNSQRLPSQVSFDPRVTRDIGLFSGAKLQLIAEAFNVFNRSNVNGVSRNPYGIAAFSGTTYLVTPGTPYGFATSSAGPRTVQLAARVTF